MKKIDKTDSKLISLLKDNGRMPNTEIAHKLELSESTVRKRIKKLIDGGLIKIVAVGNIPMLLEGIVGNIKMKIEKKKARTIIEVLNDIESVWYVAQLAGAADFDLEFRVDSQTELASLLDTLNTLDGVLDTETYIRLRLIKSKYDWETALYKGNINSY